MSLGRLQTICKAHLLTQEIEAKLQLSELKANKTVTHAS